MVAGDPIVLLGGGCSSCGRLAFPRPVACPACASTDVGDVELGADGGSLWAWTSVQVAPPGYAGPVPYGFGVVELDEGLRVVGRLEEADVDRLAFGDRMTIVAAPISATAAAWTFRKIA